MCMSRYPIALLSDIVPGVPLDNLCIWRKHVYTELIRTGDASKKFGICDGVQYRRKPTFLRGRQSNPPESDSAKGSPVMVLHVAVY